MHDCTPRQPLSPSRPRPTTFSNGHHESVHINVSMLPTSREIMHSRLHLLNSSRPAVRMSETLEEEGTNGFVHEAVGGPTWLEETGSEVTAWPRIWRACYISRSSVCRVSLRNTGSDVMGKSCTGWSSEWETGCNFKNHSAYAIIPNPDPRVVFDHQLSSPHLPSWSKIKIKLLSR